MKSEFCQEKGVHLLKRVAENGNAEAHARLAVLYHNGFKPGGIDKSYEKAMKHHKVGALHGFASSQYILSNHQIHEMPDGKIAGIVWVTLCAAQGFNPAMDDLSFYHHSNFLGVEYSMHRSMYWIKKAAMKGYPTAQFNLAKALVEAATDVYGSPAFPGFSVIPEALFWARKAEKGHEGDAFERRRFLEYVESKRDEACSCCGKPPQQDQRLKCCTRCRSTAYCGKDCQRRHWKMGHKVDCFSPPEELKDATSD